jgi:acetyl-CoA carboxylase carboxyltransferase component
VLEIMQCVVKRRSKINFAWPSAELAVMGGTQAAKVLAQIEASSLKKSGEVVDEAKEAALF